MNSYLINRFLVLFIYYFFLKYSIKLLLKPLNRCTTETLRRQKWSLGITPHKS